MNSYQDAYESTNRARQDEIMMVHFNSGQCSLLNLTSNCFDTEYLKTECMKYNAIYSYCIDKCELFCDQYIANKQFDNDMEFIKLYGIEKYESMLSDRKYDIFLYVILYLGSHMSICTICNITWDKSIKSINNNYLTYNQRPLFSNENDTITLELCYGIVFFVTACCLIMIQHVIGYVVRLIISIDKAYTFHPTIITFTLGFTIYPIMFILLLIFVCSQSMYNEFKNRLN
jgi:hypothetical protein